MGTPGRSDHRVLVERHALYRDAGAWKVVLADGFVSEALLWPWHPAVDLVKDELKAAIKED
jgi:hypothetical protein